MLRTSFLKDVCKLWEENFEPLLAVVKIYTVHLICGRLGIKAKPVIQRSILYSVSVVDRQRRIFMLGQPF